jgi:hypothetical protein
MVDGQPFDDLRPEPVIAQKGVSAAENQAPFLKKGIQTPSARGWTLKDIH